LSHRFFRRHTLQVAPDLLGCEVWVRRPGERVRRGRIVEVEAYRGFDDRACHGWRGETPRLRTFFGPGGHAFVYITYGIHAMLNFVTEGPDYPSGVLIRALESIPAADGPPLEADMRGPGLLTRAMGITRGLDGSDLRSGPAALPWRFFIAGNPSLSRGRPTNPDRAAEFLAQRIRRRTEANHD
jgi:DNA-3-methyladenine glycosylase